MAQFCTQCGAELSPGSAFCTNCGAPGTAPESPTAPQPIREPQPSSWSAPQPVQAVPAVCTEEPVGFGTYFGLMLLFALPVIGQIACIILCFAPKRRSLKNFARATLVWFVIALILSAILGLVVNALVGAAVPYFEQLTAELGGLGELGELFGGLEGLMESLPGALNESLPNP